MNNWKHTAACTLDLTLSFAASSDKSSVISISKVIVNLNTKDDVCVVSVVCVVRVVGKVVVVTVVLQGFSYLVVGFCGSLVSV